MADAPIASRSTQDEPGDRFRQSAPQLSLPKGGGAIRGIGEKFAANPVTGTGALTVPIAASPGRGGFGPKLDLAYDSGAGNGPFGIGWGMALPSIARKTDKGLPRYSDADESDVFVLSGAEDLVPAFKSNPDGSWVAGADGSPTLYEDLVNGFVVKRYRPRIEGLFARIERWTRVDDGDTHWRSISKDNIVTVYGDTLAARVADPANPTRVFSWLISQSYDDKGNAIAYVYVGENEAGVDKTQANERNRIRTANRYLKYIRYGNRQPILVDPSLPSFRRSHVPTPDFGQAGWMFDVVFDYGEGHYQEMNPDADKRVFASATLQPAVASAWPARLDPFSNYRSGFEVRSYRLCRRVLMFHHFPRELGVEDCLVRSTEFTYQERLNGSFISQIVQSGFKRVVLPAPAPYLRRSMPALEFGYSHSPLDDMTFDGLPVHEVDESSMRDLPAGIDGNSYRWIDLDGEGISGVLSEQARGWYYKRNLGEGSFGATRFLGQIPSTAALGSRHQQFLDLAGDGNVDLVEFGSPVPGFFSRTADAGWDRFRTFITLPNIDWQDPNLRMVDLTGDGHADVLVTEDQAYTTWHSSHAEDGFGQANRVPLPIDEEDGPRLVFSDGTQSIYLADMSGDGLSDIVRIRRSDVCYWPNIGYGKFGSKVAFDNVPWFDDAESFDQRRVHLSDTDGSGPTDIVYAGRDGIRIYLNQHGNSLSDARLLSRVPRVDDRTAISVVDFLGRGTACLLWSSPLPSDSRRSLRYVDLMGGIKPHLLTLIRNNLGAETSVEYASSTKFYLADKAAGTPWVTRLPFPVHVVTRVETRDLISGNRFVASSTYHHGYFDGIEREFRGFSRVEQLDTEEFSALGVLAGGNGATNQAAAFRVPPTLTKTWFHTGAYFAGARISRHLESEYYHEGDAVQSTSLLLDDTVLPAGMSTVDIPEAIRSLKGSILRQEVYAIDGTEAQARPYSASERNYTIAPLQPRGRNWHAVYFTHSRETVDFHYERKLAPVLNGKIVDAATAALNPNTAWLADPRVSQSMVLEVDDYGNVEKSVSFAYGRRYQDADPALNDADRTIQEQTLVTLTRSRVTNVVETIHAYRAPLPAEARTYELIKLTEAYAALAANPAPPAGTTPLFRFETVKQLLAAPNDGAIDLPYEDVAASGATQALLYRKLIEDTQTLYRSNHLQAPLLPLGSLESLALPGEAYKLAFTSGLIDGVFQRPTGPDATEGLLPLPDRNSVMQSDSSQTSDRGGYVELLGDGSWWVPSGRAYFHPDAAADAATELAEAVGHFFLPRRIEDPFGFSSFVDYDDTNRLLPVVTRDALKNTVAAVYDYRVLQTEQVTDPNGNRSSVCFDTLGMAVARAIWGKPGKDGKIQGDSLLDFGDFDADPTLSQLHEFVADPAAQASSLLKSATTRFVYDLDRFARCNEPAFTATLARETHVSDLAARVPSKIQLGFAYSDGFGRELQSKLAAAPGSAPERGAAQRLPSDDVAPGPLLLDSGGKPVQRPSNPRWVGKGRTVFNNKGKPVKQYEPFFSSTHLYEPEPEVTDTGVSRILFYDPLERVVVTLHPNHTYEKVLFNAWRQESWDVNDTVLLDPGTDPDVASLFVGLQAAEFLPTWYSLRIDAANASQAAQIWPDAKLRLAETAAAAKAAAHASTPAVTQFDCMGRPFLAIADNGMDAARGKPQLFATRTLLDIEGNEREVVDALGRVVMRYDYDMLGRRIHQASMEAGQRWMLNEVGGKAIRKWDSRGHNFRTEYDSLRRPLNQIVLGKSTADSDPRTIRGEIRYEMTEYGEGQDKSLNLCTRVFRHWDTAGIVTHRVTNPQTGDDEAYDFKGNLLRSTRQLFADYKGVPDWSKPNQELTGVVYTASTRYDALNRPTQSVAPHDQAGAILNVIQHAFNEANQVERIEVWLARNAEPSGALDPVAEAPSPVGVTYIDYDAKGQRALVAYSNGVRTTYSYDPLTFRLARLYTQRPASQFPDDCPTNPQPRWPGCQVQNLNYTYDPVGNISRIEDKAQQKIYFNNVYVEPSSDYVYDPIYRLTSATGREQLVNGTPMPHSSNDAGRTGLPQPNNGKPGRYTETYNYDAVGNFTAMSHNGTDPQNPGWARAYRYAERSQIEPALVSNRLTSSQVSNEVAEPYSTNGDGYDAHGNMLQMPHLPLMQWDFKDRLIASQRQVVNAPEGDLGLGERTYYVYDATGQRVRKCTELATENPKSDRIYLDSSELYIDYGASGIQRETLHVDSDGTRIALIEIKTSGLDDSPDLLIRYQFGNHLGSVSLELDAVANPISYEEYTPYGSTSYQSVSTTSGGPKRYRFTAKERDEESGLSYHSARYYNSWLGRWQSVDPAINHDYIISTNGYEYCLSRPTGFVDKDGNTPTVPNSYIRLGAAISDRYNYFVEELKLSGISDRPSLGVLAGENTETFLRERFPKVFETQKGYSAVGSGHSIDVHSPELGLAADLKLSDKARRSMQTRVHVDTAVANQETIGYITPEKSVLTNVGGGKPSAKQIRVANETATKIEAVTGGKGKLYSGAANGLLGVVQAIMAFRQAGESKNPAEQGVLAAQASAQLTFGITELAGIASGALGGNAAMAGRLMNIGRIGGTAAGIIGGTVLDIINWRKLGDKPPEGTTKIYMLGPIPAFMERGGPDA